MKMPRGARRLEKEWNPQAEASGRAWEWNVWFRWVRYTTLGYILRGLIATATPMRVPLDLMLASVVGALSLGLVAVLQWLILRRYLVELRWLSWVAATVVGQLAALGFMAFSAAGSLILGPRVVEFIGVSALRLLTVIVLGGLVGAVVGFAQWLVLRRYLAKSAWWVPATFLAGAAVALLTPTGLGSSFGRTATQMIPQLISGVIVGSITGMTLIWLLRDSQNVASQLLAADSTR
jgi:hypothetical protein